MCNFSSKMIYTDKKYKSELGGRRNEMLRMWNKDKWVRVEE